MSLQARTRRRPFQMRLGYLLALVLLAGPLAGPVAGQADEHRTHVLVGVPDSGINPYHEDFYRPNLTENPCTYIEAFPACDDVEALNLSITWAQDPAHSYDEAVERDADVWANATEDQLYWIPETVFVAVMCTDREGSPLHEVSSACILDDGTSHGTGTTSSIVRESPNALIAFKQGGASLEPLVSAGVPVDVYSVSWGDLVPIPLPFDVTDDPVYIKAAGNDPRSTLVDGWSGNPEVIAVGGGYTQDGLLGDGEEEPMSAKQPDVVGPYCRKVARAQETSGSTWACGTSFAAPTVAGGLAEAVYQLRVEAGYNGSLKPGGVLVPSLGITTHDLRDAMNRTATYDSPKGDGPREATVGLPLNGPAPWLQWGWGWYDATVVDETVDHLLGDPAPPKPVAAQLYMESLHDGRRVLYG